MEPEKRHLTTRVTLTRDLEALRSKVVNIGSASGQALGIFISSLSVDTDFVQKQVASIVHEQTEVVNKLELDCMRVLSLQQPLLKDLRVVIGALQVSSHLARLLELLERLTVITSSIEDKSSIPHELREISENCNLLLSDAMSAFENGSTEVIQKLLKKNEQLNLLQDTSVKELVKRMAKESSDKIETDAQLLTCIRYLERIGDSISVMAKQIYFIYTGKKIS
ncbi:MAG TPA: phosphate uptake regulator PhoU [Vampirovibrionales bacterium]